MRGFFRKKKAVEKERVPVYGGVDATILVVDDSPTETRIFVDALTKAGFTVETASNGAEGVTMARRLHPAAIVMDVVMPVLNGFQATRQLRRDPQTGDIPIIIVTTKDQETDRTWGMRQGASDYLVKPVSPRELVARIRMVVGG